MRAVAGSVIGSARAPEGEVNAVEPGRTDQSATDEHVTGLHHGEDAEAITDLFRRYSSRIYGYARLRCGPEMADEVVADAFLTAWRLRDRIPDDPLPWLLVIARHAISNRRRSVARTARLAVTTIAVEHLAAHTAAAEDVVVDREALLSAVAQLTDEEREALVLTAWDGLSQTDAARVAGCTRRTLIRRLHRARHQLDRALATPSTRDHTLTYTDVSRQPARPPREKP